MGGGIKARFALQALPPKKPYRVMGYRAFQVLAFIKQTMETIGRPPSYREICDEFGIDKGNLRKIVVSLEKRGEVVRMVRVRWHDPVIRLVG